MYLYICKSEAAFTQHSGSVGETWGTWRSGVTVQQPSHEAS